MFLVQACLAVALNPAASLRLSTEPPDLVDKLLESKLHAIFCTFFCILRQKNFTQFKGVMMKKSEARALIKIAGTLFRAYVGVMKIEKTASQ